MTTENPHVPVHVHAATDAPVAPPPPSAPPPVAPAPVPAGTPKPEPSKARRRRLWDFLVDRGTELLAAILTLVAALLGVWGARLSTENDELATQVDRLEDSGGVLRDDNASLSQDLADATDSRDSWKERAEEAEAALDDAEATPDPAITDPSDPSDPPGPISAGTVEVFRETGATPVTISESYGINLDTRDVNWGVSRGRGDIYFYLSGSDPLIGNTNTVAVVDQPATHEHCEAQTVLQSSLNKEQVVVGRQFCTKTNEGRWAYVNIVGIDTQAATMTLHITVWSLDTD